MKNANKKSRTTKTDLDLSKPLSEITLLKLGGPEDPCFGTHDAMDSECRSCGDSEFCQIVKAQRNHLIRGKEEKKSKFRDKDKEVHEEFNEKTLKKFVRVKKKKGLELDKITRLAKKKFTPYISNFLVETRVEEFYNEK